MEEITFRIYEAKKDKKEMENLLQQYMPFIKKTISNLSIFSLEYDDKLSISMLTFVNCVYQYEVEKGNFFSFCSLCIKNRIIDESRKQLKHNKNIILISPTQEEEINILDNDASLLQYNKEMEQKSLQEEISLFSEDLKQFDLTFTQLEKICPKQKRSREQCIKISKAMLSNEIYKQYFMEKGKIPQTELAVMLKISVKTIEKHRKYILAVTLLFLGDYPQMKVFLPHYTV